MAGVPVQTARQLPRASRAQGRIGRDLRADRRPGEGQGPGRAPGRARRHAGTVTDDALLEERRDDAARGADRDGPIALASPGSTSRAAASRAARRAAAKRCSRELERLRPAELLLAETTGARCSARSATDTGVRTRPAVAFRARRRRARAQRAVRRHAISRASALADEPLAIGAAGCLLQYVRETQKSALPHLRGLATSSREDVLLLDAATRRNLELDTQPVAAGVTVTLIGVLDRTRDRRWAAANCGAGCSGRCAIARRASCGCRRSTPDRVLDATRRCTTCCATVGDVERILARVALRSARPRDLGAACASRSARLPASPSRSRRLDAPLIAALVARRAHASRARAAARARDCVETPPACCATAASSRDGYDADARRAAPHQRAQRRGAARARDAGARAHRASRT